MANIKGVLSGYEGSMLVTDSPNKWPVINSLRAPDRTFSFLGINERGIVQAVYHCREAVELTDDKPVAHIDTAEDCRGNLIQRPDEPLLPSQQGELPPEVTDRVRVIHSLDEIEFDDRRKFVNCGAPFFSENFREPEAFLPAHENGRHYPLVYITRAASFAALRAALA